MQSVTELSRELTGLTGLELQGHDSQQQLETRLAVYINQLVNTNFDRLILLLYRVDVSEQKLKQLLKDKAGEDAGLLISRLIIERQLQKIKSRQEFKQNSNNIDESEKW